MAKLTNKKLQEVKHNLYAVYTFEDDGRRCGTIGGCDIVRAMEEAESRLCLIYPNELEQAAVPRELFAEFKVREGRSSLHPVWYWVLEVEAANKRRATWQEVRDMFNLAKA